MTAPFRLYGAELSPYSLKVRSYLRYKGIEFEWLARTNARQEEFQRYAKLPLIPVLVDADENALQDSTPIIEKLEAEIDTMSRNLNKSLGAKEQDVAAVVGAHSSELSRIQQKFAEQQAENSRQRDTELKNLAQNKELMAELDQQILDKSNQRVELRNQRRGFLPESAELLESSIVVANDSGFRLRLRPFLDQLQVVFRVSSGHNFSPFCVTRRFATIL